MNNKEAQTTEFKREWREEHLKVISAFANSKGGRLIIGLDDRGNPVGLKNIKKLLEDIPNIIRNKMGITPTVETGQITNKEYMELNKNISRITATRDLNDMASMGFVHKIEGGKRKIHYVIDDAKMMQMMQK